MNIEEFRAAFMQAMQPLMEFARTVRDIFLGLAQRLRKALTPLWTQPQSHLRHLHRRESRLERRVAWKVLHEAKHKKMPQKRRVTALATT